jgi:hypothetical protein
VSSAQLAAVAGGKAGAPCIAPGITSSCAAGVVGAVVAGSTCRASNPYEWARGVVMASPSYGLSDELAAALTVIGPLTDALVRP